MHRIIGTVSVIALAGLAGAACSSGDGKATEKVTLSEYKVALSTATVEAGNVKFDVKNIGGATHEMVIVRGDSAASLPKAADGSVNEDAIAAADNIGEIEDIAAGKSVSKSFDLTPGTYVIFCNVVEEATPPVSHFSQGMSTTFTVTAK